MKALIDPLMRYVSKCLTSNHSNVFQRFLLVDITSRRGTTRNQRWNNVYVNVGIYNVQQHRINVVYFKVEMNNVRRFHFQRRVSQRWATSKQRCENDHFQKDQKKKSF